MSRQILTRRSALRGLGVSALGLVSVGTTTGQETTVTVTVDPQQVVLAPGETATLDIVVTGADRGISVFQQILFEVDSSVASITGLEYTRSPPVSAADRSEIRNDGQTLELSAALLSNTHPAAAEIAIARMTVEAVGPGQTDLTIETGTVAGAESTEAYQTTSATGSVVVEPENDGTPGNETPGNETPGNETPGNETPGNETPGNETPGNETPGNETESGNNSDGSGPGFGAGSALAGLGGVGYLLKRRLGRDTGERDQSG